MSTTTRIVLTLLIIIFLVIGLVYYYQQEESYIPPISDDYKIIGVVDMASDHGIRPAHIRNGEDVLIVIKRDTIFYRRVMAIARQAGNNSPNIRFELLLYDQNQDKLIDSEDPIWQELRAIVFYDDGRSYQAKTLPEVGIRAISLKHITEKGNHPVILSNGTTRTLYEFGAPLQIPTDH